MAIFFIIRTFLAVFGNLRSIYNKDIVMRTKNEYYRVMELFSNGLKQKEIVEITGIPRETIRDWIKVKPKFIDNELNNDGNLKDYLISNPELYPVYSYILGLYLGDGYINKCGRTYRLRIALDKKYSNLNDYSTDKLQQLFKNNKIGVIDHENHIDLSVYNNDLLFLFPQTGIGFKHNRSVGLLDWQMDILVSEELLRGLIYSDGCYYCETIGGKYNYERYIFTNKSTQLHELFQDQCKRLNIAYTFNIRKDLICDTKISKKNCVIKLKRIIGDKENIA